MKNKHKIWGLLIFIVLVVFVGLISSKSSEINSLPINQSFIGIQSLGSDGDKYNLQNNQESISENQVSTPNSQYETCPTCGGHKYLSKPLIYKIKQFSVCKGATTIKTWVPDLGRYIEVPCSTCGAKGYEEDPIPDTLCPTCGGSGQIKV